MKRKLNEVEAELRREARTIYPYVRGQELYACIGRMANLLGQTPRRSRQRLLRLVDEEIRSSEHDLQAAASDHPARSSRGGLQHPT